MTSKRKICSNFSRLNFIQIFHRNKLFRRSSLLSVKISLIVYPIFQWTCVLWVFPKFNRCSKQDQHFCSELGGWIRIPHCDNFPTEISWGESKANSKRDNKVSQPYTILNFFSFDRDYPIMVWLAVQKQTSLQYKFYLQIVCKGSYLHVVVNDRLFDETGFQKLSNPLYENGILR